MTLKVIICFAEKVPIVPIVCVMVEGGVGTIDTVWNALKNNTPCVVIKGTGRCADLLAFAIETKDKIKNEQELRKTLKEKAKTILKMQASDKKTVKKIVDGLISCLEMKEKIRVFEFDEEDGESPGMFFSVVLM